MRVAGLLESGRVVTDVEYNAKRFFLHHLKQYIENNVLKEYIQEMPKIFCKYI